MSAETKTRRSKFDIPPESLSVGAQRFIPASDTSVTSPPQWDAANAAAASRFMQDIAESKGSEEELTFHRPIGFSGSHSYAPPPPQLLPDIASIISSFAAAPVSVSARDPAFSTRLEKAMSKNLSYLAKKDAGLLAKASTVPAAPRINAAAYNEQMKQKSGIGAPAALTAVQQQQQQQASANVAWDQKCSAYVAGLPRDFTEKELDILFSKIGTIRKLRLYRDASGNKKGDGLITYTKPESVAVACAQLNHLDIGDGYILSVSPADYSQSSNKTTTSTNDSSHATSTYAAPDTTAAPSKSATTVSARPISTVILPSDCESDKYPVAIIANVFTAANVAQEGVQFLKELEMDMLVEFCKYGTVKRIVVSHPELPEGTITAAYSTEAEARRCADALDGRHFDGRRLSTSITLPPLPSSAPTTATIYSQPLISTNVASESSSGEAVDVDQIAENVEDFLNSLI